jgi:hypothetical protein
VDAGEHGTPAAARPRGKLVTFDEFLIDYGPLFVAENKSGPATIASLKAQFRRPFGKKPLADITDKAFDKYRTKRLQAGIKPSTVCAF